MLPLLPFLFLILFEGNQLFFCLVRFLSLKPPHSVHIFFGHNVIQTVTFWKANLWRSLTQWYELPVTSTKTKIC